MITHDLDYYRELVPSQNSAQPKFMAVLETLLEGHARIQEVSADWAVLFNLDSALGTQLDVLGEWVGISRLLRVPVMGVYFEWDGTDLVGWDAGIWQGTFDPDSGIVALNDEDYRRLIRTKILINHWDGSQEQMLAIWNQFLPDGRPGIIVDNQDMSISLGFEGGPLVGLQLAVLLLGLPLIKPSGVRILEVFSATNDEPLLFWDSDPGWDVAYWSILIDV